MVALVILLAVVIAMSLRMLVLEIDVKVMSEAERITGGKIEKIRRQIQDCKKDD
jgi:hypothetical protein